ncbi:MAG: hypothetical protein K2X93_02745 [Candidatus Obscuribacterales bacterium]|nr:hypothetical protein [Candidatus Obscuribacterales bacterium]
MQRSENLHNLLKLHDDKRIAVVGTTCTGKSTLLLNIPNALDMDEILFPLLTEEEIREVCQTPWTEEIGNTMNQLARARIKIKPGAPVFGTVVLDCDQVVLLNISDKLLKERCASRRVSFVDAKEMQEKIMHEIERSGLPVIGFHVG